MSAELAVALCGGNDEDMPSVLYVRTTQLEAELLEEKVLEAFPDAGDHVGVWMKTARIWWMSLSGWMPCERSNTSTTRCTGPRLVPGGPIPYTICTSACGPRTWETRRGRLDSAPACQALPWE